MNGFNTKNPLLITGVAWGASMVTLMGSSAVTLTVPGTADPWLAGMPSGSTASADHRPPGSNPASIDMSPEQSPVEVSGIDISEGAVLSFSASGLVAHGNVPPDSGPEGGEGSRDAVTAHNCGAENGLSDIVAPFNAVLGVFLGSAQPDPSNAPSALNFGSRESREYPVLAPALGQVFFIGSGLLTNGMPRRVCVPVGARRLFLGVMDSCTWNDNTGAFKVTVSSALPTPSTSAPSLAVGFYPGVWVSGMVGRIYRLEASEDSESWHTITNSLLSVSPQLFPDFTATGSAHRFYRAVELP